jgi:integrase
MVPNLTDQRIERATCPAGKTQHFIRDGRVPGLALRVTASGSRAFVFEGRVPGQKSAARVTLGDARVMPLADARERAMLMAAAVERGDDFRSMMRSTTRSSSTAATGQGQTLGELWAVYLRDGTPRKKQSFKPRYRLDLERLIAGPAPKTRGKGMTLGGALHPLSDVPVAQLDEATLLAWFGKQVKDRPAEARRALTALKGLERWCSDQPELRGVVDLAAVRARSLGNRVVPATSRTDGIEDEHLPGVWRALDADSNRPAAVLIQALILTGARREEMAALKWSDCDLRARFITINDKVTTKRTIPIGLRLAGMLDALPRVDGNPHVFTAASKTGRVMEPSSNLERALGKASAPHCCVHGLRRTFLRATDSAAIPESAARQIAGHAAASVHHKYKLRPPEGLRPFVESLERHVFALVAGPAEPSAPTLKLVSEVAA